jgi:LuxR family maltose regulon positive regulatory protein
MNSINILKKDSMVITAHKNDPFHLIRHRINVFLTNSTANKPVTVICAGTGCGKTRAVSDFLRFTNDSDVVAYDDLHFSIKPEVFKHLENILNGEISDLKLILIYRDLPDALRDSINALRENDLVSFITESDLNFTEVELVACLKQQRIAVDMPTVREVLKDTGGWSFAINLAARSLKNVPKYTGFVKAQLKPNIFEFMESETWSAIPENVQRFLVCLALIDRLYVELVYILAGGDDELLNELKQQHAYINSGNSEGVYVVHHLYLDFLRSKQNILEKDEKLGFYKTAAFWCKENNYKTDAQIYKEKIASLGSKRGTKKLPRS